MIESGITPLIRLRTTKDQRTMSEESSEPWYKDGLAFNCSQCGDCCTGGPGYVWVNKEEMQKMAEVVGITDLDEFKHRYTRKIGVRYSLKELSNYDCIFFDNKTRKCQVYDARPRQCKTWPFWDSNLKSPETWKQTCKICPGSGEGQLHQLEEIEERRSAIRI